MKMAIANIYASVSQLNYRVKGGETVNNKETSREAYINYMLMRLLSMFKYENLPDSLPQEAIETLLLLCGSCAIVKDNDGKLYAVPANSGGEPDAYYRYTKIIVANPYLEMKNKTFTLNEDCVLMRNDYIWYGLYPLMDRYATLMAENVLTIRTTDIFLRIIAMISAPDDKTRTSAEAFIKAITNGDMSVLADNSFLGGVKLQTPPSNNGSFLTQFIELQQYLKGSFFNEIGINANFNMKRESLGDGETSLNEDILKPLVDQMLEVRKQDVEKINQMYGTNITVDFSSVWKENKEENQIFLENLRNENTNEVSQLNETEKTEETQEVETQESQETQETQEIQERQEIEDTENVEEKAEEKEDDAKEEKKEKDDEKEEEEDES